MQAFSDDSDVGDEGDVLTWPSMMCLGSTWGRGQGEVVITVGKQDMTWMFPLPLTLHQTYESFHLVSSGTRDWEAFNMRIHVHSHCKSDELAKLVAHIPATTAYPFIFQHFGICHVTNDDAMGDPWADIEAILRVIYQSMIAVH